MYCPNCGAEVPEGAAACDHCGTQLVAGEPAPLEPALAQPALAQPASAQPTLAPVAPPAPVTPPPPLPPVPPYPPVYGAPAAETSGLAIASMVLGIVSILAGGGMLLIPGILALVLGYMARNQIRESGGRVRGDEFALVGMITGGISLALGLLICLLFLFGFGATTLCSCVPFCLLPFTVGSGTPQPSRY